MLVPINICVQVTPRHILIKLTKIKHKEQILKAAREKQQITYKGIPIRISIETLQARREWQDILRTMKENNLQPRLLCNLVHKKPSTQKNLGSLGRQKEKSH